MGENGCGTNVGSLPGANGRSHRQTRLKGNFLIRLLGPFFKKQLYNEKPFKPGLPTDKSFKITEPRAFEKEKVSLLQMIEGFSEETMAGRAHPFFGKMTKDECSKGMWKHLDHHLKQFGG
jgi:hypothetical protein